MIKKNQLSRWKVKNTNIMASEKMSEENKMALDKLTENKVIDLAGNNMQIIRKKGISSLMQLKEAIKEEILMQDNVNIAQKIMELNLKIAEDVDTLLNEMIEEEQSKRRKHKQILIFCASTKIENNKMLLSELRKNNEGQHKMRFGSKSVNINVEAKQSLNDWLDNKEPIIEAETEPPKKEVKDDIKPK